MGVATNRLPSTTRDTTVSSAGACGHLLCVGRFFTLLFSFRVSASQLSLFLSVCVQSSRFEVFFTVLIMLLCRHQSFLSPTSKGKDLHCVPNPHKNSRDSKKNAHRKEMEILDGVLSLSR